MASCNFQSIVVTTYAAISNTQTAFCPQPINDWSFLKGPNRVLRGVDCVWNVMAHTQKPDFVFRRNGRVHLNRRGPQFNRLLVAEVCASAVVMVVMLDTPCSDVVWRVLATHSIRQFPLPCVTVCHQVSTRGEFRPRQTRQLPRAVDLKGRLLSCQSY